MGLIVPETLTEENYVQWKRCLRNYLLGHGLWGVVSGKEPEPDKEHQKEQHAEWRRKNALALHAIQLSCGTGIYSKFEHTHLRAQYAWTHLVQKAPVHNNKAAPLFFDHEDDSPADDSDRAGKAYLKYEKLYRAIEEGNLRKTKTLVDQMPQAVKARVSSHDDTALHIAILCGHIEIAEYLVGMMEVEDLTMTNEYGATALSLAAICGEIKLGRKLVDANPALVIKENGHDDGQLPVIVAALYGQKKMVHYLFEKTPITKLSPENGKQGAKLLNCLITAEIYDVASVLLKRYPKLGVMEDSEGHYALKILAEKPSAFPSGTKYSFWEKLIYRCVRIHSPWDDNRRGSPHEDIAEDDHIGLSVIEQNEEHDHKHKNLNLRGLLHKVGWGILQSFVPEIKSIHHRKLVHDESVKLLATMFKEIRTLNKTQLEKMNIDAIIYHAIKHGIVEFITEMLKYKPEIIWKKDEKGRTIFAHAIVLRQEKIYRLIYGLGTKTRIIARRHDVFRNNFLHLAAKLSPRNRLEQVSGAALQMQRELQWYKEVESIVQPKLKEELNENNKTPEVLFTEEHRELVKDAESWMKSTSGSSMIVGTLIAAVMFTTAFTVPGGNKNDTGLPTMLDSYPTAFLIFMISNALSLFSSSTSLLMFLGILTARYAEEDFLRSLPTKLIFGLLCLFVSVVTMMSSFGAALYLILHARLSWVTIPIIILSVIPIALFSVLQFPILIEMSFRTYGSGICNKPKKNALWKFFRC